jgi:hypothetical protein
MANDSRSEKQMNVIGTAVLVVDATLDRDLEPL